MWGKDDEEYVDPSEYSGRPRVSYESARQTVQDNQNYRQDQDGNVVFDSVFSDDQNTVNNYLNPDGTDPTYQDHHGRTRRPVMDHVIQYAALDEAYERRVVYERNEAAEGRPRRNSVDLFNAFHSAASDPDNLRLLTHQEHVAIGGNKHKGQFSEQEQGAAEDLFNAHLDAQGFGDQNAFHQNRPRASIPLNVDHGEPTRHSERLQGKSQDFSRFFK